MASYYTDPITYIAFDLRSGAYLGRIPLNGVQFSSQLLVTGGTGTLSGTVDIGSAAVQALNPLALTQPGRTMLCVDYLGAIVWAGIVWPRGYKFDGATRVLNINATELWSYFNSRVQATDYSSPPYSGLTGTGAKMAIWDATNTDADGIYDPMLIAWQVLSDALTQVTDGNILGGLGIAANSYTSTTSYLASGTATPSTDYDAVSYPLTSVQTVNTIISMLAQNGYGIGFDYAVDVAYSAGPGSVPVGTVNLSYPRRGRIFADNNLVLNCGSALDYDVPEDASQSANTVYEQGISGSLIVSQNVAPLDYGYPVLEQIKSRANVQSPSIISLLTGIGASDLYTLSFPVATPSVTMDLFKSSIPLGSFIVGDNCMMRVPKTDGNGNVFDPRFPDGLYSEWRIVGYNATVADAGQSKLTFNLALPPAPSISGPYV